MTDQPTPFAPCLAETTICDNTATRATLKGLTYCAADAPADAVIYLPNGGTFEAFGAAIEQYHEIHPTGRDWRWTAILCGGAMAVLLLVTWLLW